MSVILLIIAGAARADDEETLERVAQRLSECRKEFYEIEDQAYYKGTMVLSIGAMAGAYGRAGKTVKSAGGLVAPTASFRFPRRARRDNWRSNARARERLNHLRLFEIPRMERVLSQFLLVQDERLRELDGRSKRDGAALLSATSAEDRTLLKTRLQYSSSEIILAKQRIDSAKELNEALRNLTKEIQKAFPELTTTPGVWRFIGATMFVGYGIGWRVANLGVGADREFGSVLGGIGASARVGGASLDLNVFVGPDRLVGGGINVSMPLLE